jgi:hypothetical protein
MKNYTEEYYKALFASHVVEAEDGSDCHLWTGGKNNIGYGLWRYDGKMRTVHRVMAKWEGHNIDGKVVYHSCDNYNCVNPLHLSVGSRTDKAQVMVAKGRAGTFWKDAKYQQTCEHCGYVGSPAVVAHRHNDRCEFKP